MSKGKIAGQAKEDVEANGKDPKDHETLHQVGIARVELRHARALGEGVQDERCKCHQHCHQDQKTCVFFIKSEHRLVLHHAFATHQATGTCQQNDDGHQIDDDLVQAGQNLQDLAHGCKALKDTQEEACKHRAGQRAHAADNNHNKAEDKEIHAHVVVGRVDRGVHHTCETRDRSRYPEHQREPAVDVDAQQLHSFPVGHPGPHNHPKGGELQERKDRTDDDRRKSKVDQPPIGVDDHIGIKAQGRAKVERAAERIRGRRRDRVCAVIILDDLLQNDGQAKGHKDLVRVGTLVEVFDQAAFHQDTDADHDRDRKEDRKRHRPVDNCVPGRLSEPVINIWHIHLERVAEEVGLRVVNHRVADRDNPAQGDRAERSDHEQGAVRKVDHAERAKNERKTERDQRIGRALVESVEDLKDDCFHRSDLWLEVLPAPHAGRGQANAGPPLWSWCAYAPGLHVPSSPPAICGWSGSYVTCSTGVTSTISSRSNSDVGFSLPFTTRTSLKHWWSAPRYSVLPLPMPSNSKSSSASTTAHGLNEPARSTASA
mmetsp:Transcript_23278/g.40216  ORF Transcript_23278/g.40216 Transcript_23278/m.40216 type:complete len:543 (-) Transcript_23278:1165-2793(-)